MQRHVPIAFGMLIFALALVAVPAPAVAGPGKGRVAKLSLKQRIGKTRAALTERAERSKSLQSARARVDGLRNRVGATRARFANSIVGRELGRTQRRLVTGVRLTEARVARAVDRVRERLPDGPIKKYSQIHKLSLPTLASFTRNEIARNPRALVGYKVTSSIALNILSGTLLITGAHPAALIASRNIDFFLDIGALIAVRKRERGVSFVEAARGMVRDYSDFADQRRDRNRRELEVFEALRAQ